MLLTKEGTIETIPLEVDAFAPYGQVVEGANNNTQTANQGTAKRRNWLAQLENLRPGARPNMCVFRVRPAQKQVPFPMRLLERHSFSTQAFIPMNGSPAGYLVIVCMNGEDDKPNLDTLRCFVARPNQAINYHPGCWHHPIIALDTQTDFVCLVWEAQDEDDCEEVFFEKVFPARFPSDTIMVHIKRE